MCRVFVLKVGTRLLPSLKYVSHNEAEKKRTGALQEATDAVGDRFSLAGQQISRGGGILSYPDHDATQKHFIHRT